jgi:hypothetical protein
MPTGWISLPPDWRKSMSTTRKRLWTDPQYRNKMSEAQRRLCQQPAHREQLSAKLAKANANIVSRLGIPNGMKRAEAEKLWDEAGKKADLAMRGFERAGILPPTDAQLASLTNEEFLQFLNDDLVSDDQLANRALRECFIIAMGPSDKRTKASAVGTILAFTKPKPAQRQAISTNIGPEEWLRAAVAAGTAS